MHHLALTPAARLPEASGETARIMAEAALIFLASLTQEQRTRASFPVESEERFIWDYRPHERAGVAWQELDRSQQRLAYALLASGLSHQGFTKAMAIMSLESVLQSLTGSQIYHPEFYYLTIFGSPGDSGAWGWRVEGHHLSVNILVLSGSQLAVTPNFFGANPAKILSGPLESLRVLAGEEDLARSLLHSLNAAQRARTVINAECPKDIVTGNERRVRLDDPRGLSYRDMNLEQQQQLQDLVMEYTRRLPRQVADERLNHIDKEGWGYLHFAWAGSSEAGQPHYYRLHGPSFLVEYDNIQNNANHIHTVWRDLKDDWGEDLLQRHYARSH
jgi:Protein of unknown function (DUF3500)